MFQAQRGACAKYVSDEQLVANPHLFVCSVLGAPTSEATML